MRRFCISLAILTALSASAQAVSTFYTGSLSSADDGLLGDGGWVADPENPVTFSWMITELPGSWHYHYVFDSTDLQGTLSHLVLETSLDLAPDDILYDSPKIQNDDPMWYTEANGNPDIPGPLFGVKFEKFAESEVLMIDFISTKMPVWGDFYAKDGSKGGAVWNAGFLLPDPLAPAANGTIDNHILRPDTTNTNTIPAPAAIVLGSLGAGLVSLVRRRRML